MVVTPGFIDGHTHMDAQVFWDPLGTCSCWHGVTTVVMGNCGFTLAPCARGGQATSSCATSSAPRTSRREAMEAGIDWRWTTFPEYLDAVDALPKGINYAGYIGHSALRTYVMGERAFDGPATEDDLAAMERELRDALRRPAPSASPRRARRATRRPTTGRWPAAWPPGTRCGGSSA